MGPVKDPELMAETKKMIRALVLPHLQTGLKVFFLNNNFREQEGRDIPYAEIGFDSLTG